MKINAENFFNELIFKPWEADTNKALVTVAALACLIFTGGIIHAVCAIRRYSIRSKDQLSDTDKKININRPSLHSISEHNEKEYAKYANEFLGQSRWQTTRIGTAEELEKLRKVETYTGLKTQFPYFSAAHPHLKFRVREADSAPPIIFNPIGMTVYLNGDSKLTWTISWDDDKEKLQETAQAIRQAVNKATAAGKKIQLADSLNWPKDCLSPFFQEFAFINDPSWKDVPFTELARRQAAAQEAEDARQKEHQENRFKVHEPESEG